MYVYVTELEGVPIKGLHAQRILNKKCQTYFSPAFYINLSGKVFDLIRPNQLLLHNNTNIIWAKLWFSQDKTKWNNNKINMKISGRKWEDFLYWQE